MRLPPTKQAGNAGLFRFARRTGHAVRCNKERIAFILYK